MILTSPFFNDGDSIPPKFTHDGGNINPELHIQNAPEGTMSFALIMDDPDATSGKTFTHWLIWNIDPKTTVIKQESKPPGAVEGINDFSNISYGGPWPPHGVKPHRYFFKLYALDVMIDLEEGSTKQGLEESIKGHVVEEAQLMGVYTR